MPMLWMSQSEAEKAVLAHGLRLVEAGRIQSRRLQEPGHIVTWYTGSQEKVTLGQPFLQPYFPNVLFYDSELLSKKQRRAHSLWVTLEREEFMLSCHHPFQSWGLIPYGFSTCLWVRSSIQTWHHQPTPQGDSHAFFPPTTSTGSPSLCTNGSRISVCSLLVRVVGRGRAYGPSRYQHGEIRLKTFPGRAPESLTCPLT